MVSGLEIRPARQEDASDIARLFLISSDGLAAYIWRKTGVSDHALDEIGQARYARTDTAFSFENCLVATIERETVAMAHAFEMTSHPKGTSEEDPVLRPYAE